MQYKKMSYQPLKIVQNSQKQLPSNIEAEQAVIGSILLSNEIFDEINLLISNEFIYFFYD